MADSAPFSELAQIAEAAASGHGLPELVRAIGRGLGAGVMLLDASGSVLVCAGRSSTDEKALANRTDDVECVPLTAGEDLVGELRVRRPAAAPKFPDAVTALIHALLAAELSRQRVSSSGFEETAARFLSTLAAVDRPGGDELLAEAESLGLGAERGLALLVVRARAKQASAEGWRDQVLAAAVRGARAAGSSSVAAPSPRQADSCAEVLVLVRAADEAEAQLRLLVGHSIALGRSRIARSGAELSRLGDEARLAVNVAEGGPGDDDGHRVLAFEDTGSYRLLLPAMSDDPAELHRFFEETIAPVVRYDEQYESNLVQTVGAFLEADGNVAGTAQRLFTHRHTVRYRLERVRELSGLDVGSSDGRERLSLGLKAMRVLGIPAPGGPVSERFAAGD
jgi:hypothetical protein